MQDGIKKSPVASEVVGCSIKNKNKKSTPGPTQNATSGSKKVLQSRRLNNFIASVTVFSKTFRAEQVKPHVAIVLVIRHHNNDVLEIKAGRRNHLLLSLMKTVHKQEVLKAPISVCAVSACVGQLVI